jgi:hypothetical protein
MLCVRSSDWRPRNSSFSWSKAHSHMRASARAFASAGLPFHLPPVASARPLVPDLRQSSSFLELHLLQLALSLMHRQFQQAHLVGSLEAFLEDRPMRRNGVSRRGSRSRRAALQPPSARFELPSRLHLLTSLSASSCRISSSDGISSCFVCISSSAALSRICTSAGCDCSRKGRAASNTDG